MAVRVTTRGVRRVRVVGVTGDLMFGESSRIFRDIIRQHLAAGSRWFVIDLGALGNVDSAGLGELVAAYSSVRDKGGDIKLTRLPEHLRDVLQTTRLLTVFDCFDDESSAVAALEELGDLQV
jgi:anti-sigma B factor antagonist